MFKYCNHQSAESLLGEFVCMHERGKEKLQERVPYQNTGIWPSWNTLRCWFLPHSVGLHIVCPVYRLSLVMQQMMDMIQV